MAGFRNIAAPMGANGKAKTEKRGRERNRYENRSKNEIAQPHRPATANSRTSPDGTHCLEGRRDERGVTDWMMDGEKSGTSS